MSGLAQDLIAAAVRMDRIDFIVRDTLAKWRLNYPGLKASHVINDRAFYRQVQREWRWRELPL